MKKALTIFLTLLFISNLISQEKEQKTENPHKKLVISAWKLSSRISPNPIKLNYVFDKSFFKLVSEEKTIEILKKLYEENGNVINVTSVTYHNEKNGDFFFHTEKNIIIPVSISVNDKGKITGVFFRPSFQKLEDPSNIFKKFEALNYEKKAMLIKKIGKVEDTIYSLNETTPLALGSAFKLYILAYLIKKDIKWEKVIRINDKSRSLPTGKSHLFPKDAPVTIFSLAEAMISESDNTATDTLIDYLGRENIENSLSDFYNSRPEINIPFLKTSEVFKLKSSTQLAQDYINLDIKGKRKLLKEIENDKIDIYKLDFTRPVFINSIEWFASAEDICRLYEYFLKENNEYANSMLSINPGLDIKTGRYIWAGYKGGSEPGVISANWILKSKNGDYYCVSSIINDSNQIINEKEYLNIMQEILNNIEQ
ncbi:MAG: class A beta-lactamase-related serine hydrolase [Elusimicrobiota bacterium]